MSEFVDREDRRVALQAYRHAVAARRAHRPRVDIVDERLSGYGAPRPRPVAPSAAWSPWPPAGRQLLEHSVAEPTATAFKVGFGFAAGTSAFRLAALAALVVVVFLVLVGTAAEFFP